MMMKQHSPFSPESTLGAQPAIIQAEVRGRKRYVPPVLVAHGRFERVTLQASGGNNITGGDGGTLNP